MCSCDSDEFKSSIDRLTRDLRQAARTLTTQEARYLVDAYYQMQEDRIRAGHQQRKLAEGGEPSGVMDWLGAQRTVLEKQVARALDAYSGANTVGEWARSITGIGPIIAAGLLAHIDIERAPTVGHIWSFAGLIPGVVWGKGQKRPWNNNLKRLCFLIGESFVKVSGNENDVYGKIWRSRKEWETQKNEAGDYKEQAAQALLDKKWDKSTDAYKAYSKGLLPPARVHMRAKRYAVKIFLSHYHHVAYEHHYKTLPPKPYVLEHCGHAHFLSPPNWPLLKGGKP